MSIIIGTTAPTRDEEAAELLEMVLEDYQTLKALDPAGTRKAVAKAEWNIIDQLDMTEDEERCEDDECFEDEDEEFDHTYCAQCGFVFHINIGWGFEYTCSEYCREMRRWRTVYQDISYEIAF